MINSINTASQSVAIGGSVTFNTDRIRTRSCGCGGWLTHDLGSALFVLSKAGIYKVDYNADVSNATASTPTSLALKINGEVVGGTTSTSTVSGANVLNNLSASTLIRVPCGASLTISLGNTSTTSISVANANIIIQKVA